MKKYPWMTSAMWLAAIKRNGWSLGDVPDDMIDREMCWEAVKEYGGVLCLVPIKFRDREICYEGMRKNDDVIKDVPEKMRAELQAKLKEERERNEKENAYYSTRK